MSENNITELRGLLFQTMRDLGSKENPMEIERAKAISDVAQTIINSAKVEVDFMRQVGGSAVSGFLAIEPPRREGSRTVPREPAPQLVNKL